MPAVLQTHTNHLPAQRQHLTSGNILPPPADTVSESTPDRHCPTVDSNPAGTPAHRSEHLTPNNMVTQHHTRGCLAVARSASNSCEQLELTNVPHSLFCYRHVFCCRQIPVPILLQANRLSILVYPYVRPMCLVTKSMLKQLAGSHYDERAPKIVSTVDPNISLAQNRRLSTGINFSVKHSCAQLL